MNALLTLAIVLYTIVCLLLILLVIIQGGKAEGLFSSAQSNVLGSQGGNIMTRATSVLAGIFICGALLISIAISAQKTSFEKVTEQPTIPTAQPTQQTTVPTLPSVDTNTN